MNTYSNHAVIGAPMSQSVQHATPRTEAELIALFEPWERDHAGNIVLDSEANCVTALRLFGATVRKHNSTFVLVTHDGKQTTPKGKNEAAALCCAITFKHFGFYPRMREMKRALSTMSTGGVRQ